jgi:hypothetical protein
VVRGVDRNEGGNGGKGMKRPRVEAFFVGGVVKESRKSVLCCGLVFVYVSGRVCSPSTSKKSMENHGN